MGSKLGSVLLVTGLALLAPAVFAVLRKPPITREAFEPLLSFDLGVFAEGMDITKKVAVPEVEQVRKKGGTGRYALVAAANSRQLHCWEKLGISVAGSIGGSNVVLHNVTGAPYGWSSLCPISGVWFSPTSGGTLELRFTSNPRIQLPPGQMLLLPFWQTEAKDRLVGSMLDDLVVKASWWTTPAACVLIACGFIYMRTKAR